MSVRTYDRTQGKLEVLDKCRVLIEHSIPILKNENLFPKRDRWILTKPIIDELIGALTCIRRANSTFVLTDADYKYRRQNQVEAHARLGAALSLIDIAFNVLNLEGRRVEYWVGLILETDDKLKSWMKSDRERYTAKQ